MTPIIPKKIGTEKKIKSERTKNIKKIFKLPKEDTPTRGGP
jgi:hypothetical protein